MAAAWQNLRDVAKADGPELDSRLRKGLDKKHGSHEQRMAVTLMEAMRQPLTKAFVPRLLWHRFYNWDLADGVVEKVAGKHESTQEDAHELLIEMLDGEKYCLNGFNSALIVLNHSRSVSSISTTFR